MKKLLLLIVFCLIFEASTAFGAATVIWGKTSILITAIDADWVWNQTGSPYITSKDGIKCDYIIFVPGAASDELKITEEDASGAEILPLVPATGADDAIVLYFLDGKHIKPFIDFSESTVSTGHRVIIGVLR